MQGPSGPFFMSMHWAFFGRDPFPDSFNQCIGFYPESVSGSIVKHHPKREMKK